jgi:hypothetical protein
VGRISSMQDLGPSGNPECRVIMLGQLNSLELQYRLHRSLSDRLTVLHSQHLFRSLEFFESIEFGQG